MDLTNKGILPFYSKKSDVYTINIIDKLPILFHFFQDSYYDSVHWGTTIWELIHVLTIKVKNCLYEEIKNDLVFQIFYIFKILPCNYCYIESLYYFTNPVLQINFTNKSDLIKMFVDFHNHVNKCNNKPIYSYDNVYKTYKYNNIYYSINKYLHILEIFPITDFERYTIQMWFKNNIKYFEI